MSAPQDPTDPARTAAPDADAPAVEDSLEITLPDESSAPKDMALWAGVLVILTLVAYWPATEGRFLIRDDRNVAENLLLGQPGGLGTIWLQRWQDPKHYPLPQYHPAAMSSYWLEYRLSGHDEQGVPTPFSYHLTNLLLHAGAAVMLWLVLRKLKLPGAWLAAGVFALHPINTESVAWISQRGTVLGGLLFFSSIYTYLLFADAEETNHAAHAPDRSKTAEPVDPARRWGLYLGALLLFVLAMLSKSNAFAMPFVVAAALWWRRRLTARLAAMLLPFVVIAFVLAFTAADFERETYGLAGAQLDLGMTHRLAIAGRAICFHAGKLIAPLKLTFLYPRWPLEVQGAAMYAPLVGAALVLVGLFLGQKRVGRGPLVGMLAFILCLLPYLGLVNIEPMRQTFVADHYAYLASAALAALVISAAAKAVGKGLGNRAVAPHSPSQAAGETAAARTPVGTVVGLSAILLVALGAATWARAHVFVDLVHLWSDTVAKNPNSAYAHGRLASALGAQADAAATLGEMEDYPRLLDAALEQARKAAALDPKDGDAEWIQGQILVRQKKPDEAIAHLRTATQLVPTLYRAWQDLAGTLLGQKRWDEAIVALDAALRVQPRSGPTHRMLGDAYAGLNDLVRAMAEYRTAIQMKDDDLLAREGLADLLAKTNQDKEAIFQFTVILQVQRERADLWYKVAILYAAKGEMGPAIKFFEQAIALKPDYEEAKRNRDLAIETLKRQAATRATTGAATMPAGN